MAHKKITVTVSLRAKKDLKEIYDYLSERSQKTLQKVDIEIFKALDRLELFPESGHYVKESSNKKYREILVFHYRMIYKIINQSKLLIITIRHGKRFLPKIIESTQTTSNDSEK